MTITTGAALAPDDDTSQDPENGSDSQETGTSDEPAISLVVTSEVVGGISLTVAPDVVSNSPPATAPDLGNDGAPAVSPGAIAPEVDSPLLSVIALTTSETPPDPERVPLADRLRAALPFTGPGLTGLGGVVLGCLVVGLGAAGDLALGHGLGPGFSATFLFGCVLVACALRTRALAVAIVLPPLLFAGSYALETRTSGQTAGLREMALDVATSLALHAPVLFIGTAVAAAAVVVRVAVRLVRR